MLFSERKRLREVEEREAAGESLWTEDIPEPARRKIAFAWEISMRDGLTAQERRFEHILDMLFKIDGHAGAHAVFPDQLVGVVDSDLFLSHVEAIRRGLGEAGYPTDIFDNAVNRTFNSHRVAYRLVEGEVVPFSSDELHTAVVEPALRLLVDARFEKAHSAYMKALKEIGHDDPSDAITDAATALQEALVGMGCEGNALGPLMKDAKKKSLLGAHDQPLIDGIGKFIDWVSSDRSTTGDAHKHSDAVLADAWLMVHVVGALIVRLADNTLRGSTALGAPEELSHPRPHRG